MCGGGVATPFADSSFVVADQDEKEANRNTDRCRGTCVMVENSDRRLLLRLPRRTPKTRRLYHKRNVVVSNSMAPDAESNTYTHVWILFQGKMLCSTNTYSRSSGPRVSWCYLYMYPGVAVCCTNDVGHLMYLISLKALRLGGAV